MEKQIYKAVEQLWKGTDAPSSEQSKWIIERLYENDKEARKKITKGFQYITLCWLIFYGIGSEFIEEGSVLSFKISKIKPLITLAPLITGYLFYTLLQSMAIAKTLNTAIHSIWSFTNQGIINSGVEMLLMQPSFLFAEGLIDQFHKPTSGDKFWVNSIFFLMLMFPVMVFVHISILAVTAGTWPIWIIILSIGVGFLLIVRGFSLIR